MDQHVLSFSELDKSSRPFAGGKGGMLARMFQDGYPVPEGFVVLPSAFHEEKLNQEASTTNVGWTPLFPRVAAIITDIGAPLSHAAIVARELGIPAVVGCGNPP